MATISEDEIVTQMNNTKSSRDTCWIKLKQWLEDSEGFRLIAEIRPQFIVDNKDISF